VTLPDTRARIQNNTPPTPTLPHKLNFDHDQKQQATWVIPSPLLTRPPIVIFYSSRTVHPLYPTTHLTQYTHMSLEKSVKKRYVEKKRTFLEKKWEEKNEIKIRNADQRLSNSLTTSMCGYSGAPPPSLPTPTHTHTHTHTNTHCVHCALCQCPLGPQQEVVTFLVLASFPLAPQHLSVIFSINHLTCFLWLPEPWGLSTWNELSSL